jgi:hypothetical protein
LSAFAWPFSVFGMEAPDSVQNCARSDGGTRCDADARFNIVVKACKLRYRFNVMIAVSKSNRATPSVK